MKTSLKLSSYLAVVIAMLVVNAPMAGAQKPDKAAAESADAYLKRGLAHYEARAFEKAINLFLAGYKVDPRPVFLFALAQAERRSGDCASALTYYRRFLATRPPASQKRAARMHIRGCKRALHSSPVVDVGHTDRDTETDRRGSRPTDQATPDPAEPAESAKKHAALAARQAATSPPGQDATQVAKPWYHDATGGVLLGTGTITMLFGAGALAASESIYEQATWSATYTEYDAKITRARRYRLWGVAAMSAGTVLVAGALYRYHRYSQRESPRERTIGISPTSGGLTISYGGQF